MNHLITVCSVALSIFFLASSPNIDAAIYKWKDDKGQIHYTAIAPEGKGIEKNNIEADIARFSKITPPTASNDTSTATENIETEQDTNDNTANNNPNTGYCKQQQEIIQSLENNPYVKWKEGDKETLLEGEAKAAQVEKIKQDMEKFCSEEKATEPS